MGDLLQPVGYGPNHNIAAQSWRVGPKKSPPFQTQVCDAELSQDREAIRHLARAVRRARRFVGRTAIGLAIIFAFALVSEAKFDTDRRVIDVSGDCTSNQGSSVTAARDAAVGAGTTINGLTIFNRRAAAMGGYLALHTNPPSELAQYYHDNVIGGTGAFVVPIDDFNSFGDAMVRKLINEIAGR